MIDPIYHYFLLWHYAALDERNLPISLSDVIVKMSKGVFFSAINVQVFLAYTKVAFGS